MVVVDDDTEEGSGAAALGLPKTVTVITGRSRKHHYFRCPEEGLGNSTSRLAPNVDVRGDGGQVVFVGSIHPKTGQPYAWADGLSPDEVKLARFPPHLLLRLQLNTKQSDLLKRRAQRALQRAVDVVMSAPEGTRNDVLNREAFKVGRFLGEDHLIGRTEIESRLARAARRAGLNEKEILPTITSGLNAGAADPHDFEKPARQPQKGTRKSSRQGGPHDADARPEIVVEGGKLPEIVTEAETALEADQGPPLFRRGTALVRIARTEAPTVSEWFNRKTGALVLIPIEAMYLVERFTQAARWLKYDARMGGYRRIDCPVRVARTYMARCGTWKVPILTGIIESPTLRPDGTVLCTRGYDAETGLFLDPGATKFVPIPQEPTRENAIAALSKLREPLKDFPFVGPSDRAAALASILTAVVRWRLRSAPLFAFRAPKMASGKSLLADVVAMIATGRPAAVMSQGQNEEESRKRITALLVEGSSVICVDNIEEPFGGASICSVLTQTVWKDRILGQTRTVTVPTTATWLATGNNLIFTGDIVTRVVVCDLDPNCEHPEDRRFDVNLHKYVPDHRSELVSAALIVLRAYIVAGKPKLNVPVFGRFEEWSDLVRSALIWLGEADPCGGRRRIEVVDPVSQRLGAVLLAWSRAFESKTVTASEIIAQAKKHPESALGQSLRQVALDSTGNFDTHRLGMWLSTIERRIEGGLRVERRGKKQGIALWGVNSA